MACLTMLAGVHRRAPFSIESFLAASTESVNASNWEYKSPPVYLMFNTRVCGKNLKGDTRMMNKIMVAMNLYFELVYYIYGAPVV